MKIIRPKKILFIDMDGVLADFDGYIGKLRGKPYIREKGVHPPEMWSPGFYTNIPVMDGAREAVDELLHIDTLDIYIGTKSSTKPTTGNAPYMFCCPSEKYDWVQAHFPELLRKIVIACDKGLLRGDYLIDDTDRWINKFQGTYIKFDADTPSREEWEKIVAFLKSNAQ